MSEGQRPSPAGPPGPGNPVETGRARLTSSSDRLWLAALVLVGGILRFSTLTWGIGLGELSGFYHPDEPKVWGSVMNFPWEYLSNPRYIYGTAVQYTVGFLLLPVRLLRKLGFAHLGLSDVQVAALFIRSVHAALGTATILVTLHLGSRVFDRRTAVLGAGLLAVSFLHVLNSPLATLDVPMSFLVALNLVLLLGAWERGRRGDFIVWGVALGFLGATKVSAVAFLGAPLALGVVAALGKGDGGRAAGGAREWWKGCGLAALVAAAVFGVTTPHVLLHLPDYVHFMEGQRSSWMMRVSHDPVAMVEVRARATASALTPLVAVLALVGMVQRPGAARVRRLPMHAALLAFLAADVLFWRGYVLSRFVLPTVPVLCLYAARPLAALASAARPLARRMGVGLAGLALVSSLVYTLGGIHNRHRDPRAAAARYIDARVPPGARLAMAGATGGDSWWIHRWRYPVVDQDRHPLVPVEDDPDFIVTSSYVMDAMRDALASGVMGTDLVWPDSLAGRWYRSEIPAPAMFELYEGLLGGAGPYRLEGCWRAPAFVPIEFPEPEIRLYRRAHEGDAAGSGGLERCMG